MHRPAYHLNGVLAAGQEPPQALSMIGTTPWRARESGDVWFANVSRSSQFPDALEADWPGDIHLDAQRWKGWKNSANVAGPNEFVREDSRRWWRAFTRHDRWRSLAFTHGPAGQAHRV